MCSADRMTEVSCLAKQSASILLLRHIVCLSAHACHAGAGIECHGDRKSEQASERRGLSRRRCPAPRRLARFYAAASVIFPPVASSKCRQVHIRENKSGPRRRIIGTKALVGKNCGALERMVKCTGARLGDINRAHAT